MVSKSLSRVDIAVQDILTRHKSTGEPVRQIASQIIRSRGLGSKERQLAVNSVFEILRQKPWPEWFIKRLKKQYGPAFEALEADLRKRPAPNTPINCLTTHETLWIDPGSLIIAQKIKAKPEEQVLDLCAGLGGKTKVLLDTKAHITAVDISDKRLAKIPGVQRIVADARKVSFSQKFDWILVDAPCSGTGTIRRAPDLFGRLQERDLEIYAQLQREIVKNAIRFLKPNGRLIYATCSLLEEENHIQFDRLELIESEYLEDGFYVAVFKST